MSVWTLEAWIIHSNELDRERERALNIKETADARALVLASENQRLRDEAHNEILKKWQDERSVYATKTEVEAMGEKIATQIDALKQFHAVDEGRQGKALDTRTAMFGVAVIFATVVAAVSPHIH